MKTPVLSLVTGTMNRPECFRRLVDSIVRHTETPWELVASDASDVAVECDHPGVRILPERPRLGCVLAYNLAFRDARGEFVIWLNDDAEVLAGYDSAAIRFMESHPQIGLGALHYSEDGGAFRINSAWHVPYANFGIIRRELGNQVGWFDEDLKMYGCDNSLTFRVLLSGAGISDIPGAQVIHHSEKDQHRIDNQKARRLDNEVLTQKYMPFRAQWHSAYWRNRVETGTIPWSHGVDPRLAGVR